MTEVGGAPVDLHARDEGTGSAVLLLHGVGGDHTVWNAVVPELAQRFRVIAPDLRGHGRSPAPPGSECTFSEMLKDVIRVLDGKEIRSAHWVGLSAGGQLALRASLDRPDRTRSLAMFGGSAYTDPHTRAIADRWAQTLATDGADAYALRRLKDLYYPDWIEAHLDVADRAREDARHRELSWAGQWSRAVAAFDERDRIRWLTCPILLVHGLDDTVVDPAHGRIFRQSVPGAQLRLLPQTGHMVPVERPQETLEILEGFLDGVETPGGDRSRR